MTARKVKKTRKTRRDPRIILDMADNRGRYGMAGYESASSASYHGRLHSSKSGAEFIAKDREAMIARSRAFMRDREIYKGMIEGAVATMIGPGYTLQAMSDDDGWNREAEAIWSEFNARPEIKGIWSGSDVARMVCRELLVAGDHGVILLDEDELGKVQLVEAEQIKGATQGMRDDGIKKDDQGRPEEFFVGDYKPSGQVQARNNQSYPPDEFLFLTLPERPSAIRGVPALQSAFPMIYRISDVCDSEAIAWQMLARFAVVINRAGAASLSVKESREDPSKSSDELEGDLSTRVTEIDSATIFHGEKGEEVRGIERTIPGKDFGDSLRAMLRLCGLAIGMPLELILLDWTEGNYSQSRAVTEQTVIRFLVIQEIVRDFYYAPLYEWVIENAMAVERLSEKDEDEAFAHSWIMPVWPWIDQLKESQAFGSQVDRGQTLHAEVLKRSGHDRSDWLPRRKQEIIDAQRAAQEIEAETDIQTDWRPLAGGKEQREQGRPAGETSAANTAREQNGG